MAEKFPGVSNEGTPVTPFYLEQRWFHQKRKFEQILQRGTTKEELIQTMSEVS